eukprot:CAMPEP_0172402874 /NCGR_PEP_ID=MMETSP1061-20121228/56483_1 /TAXON_ID=37318 /ORGANISM="Pseudo-nitzschia pungens, Strain cf. pungens" /LENGTH=95 /DNA_ID=CAMNT_0013137023 /DNA_START=162 /DNA_END=446 /DNA_ORIENTATION=-
MSVSISASMSVSVTALLERRCTPSRNTANDEGEKEVTPLIKGFNSTITKTRFIVDRVFYFARWDFLDYEVQLAYDEKCTEGKYISLLRIKSSAIT